MRTNRFRVRSSWGRALFLPSQPLVFSLRSVPKIGALLPFLNGEDVNSRPDQSPSRLVVNFFDWPLDRESSSEGYAGYTASDFPECLEIVRQRVKPEHDRSNRKVYREKWWQYAEKQSKLYDLIARLRRVIVIPLVSKYLVMSWQELGPVFSHALGVIVSDDDSDFALLQSTIHEDWARQFGSTLETRMRYALTDCYETFPFPAKGPKLRLREAGSAYHEHRLAVARNRQEGLTKTYNRFHDPGESHADVQRLRELHVEIDSAVSLAYGWSDLDLGHDFHDTRHGTRFRISESARREVLAGC